MSKNLIKKVMIKEDKPEQWVVDMIDKIESGYLVGREPKHRVKKSFSPSSLVYGNGKCFAGETEFLTDEGYKTLLECAGQEVTVWTGGSRIGNSKVRKAGGWKKATVVNFGQQQLFKVTVSRNGVTKEIFTTANHRWLTRNRVDRSPIKVKETLDLVPGDKFEQSNTSDITSKNISWDGIRHGFVYGDGYIDKANPRSGSVAVMFGAKDDSLMSFFDNAGYSVGDLESREITDVKSRRVRGLPRSYKSAPSIKESSNYLLGFLSGYFAADGNINKGGSATISSSKIDSLLLVKNICGVLRIGHGEISGHMRTGINGAPSMIFSITLSTQDLDEGFFIHQHHKDHFNSLKEKSKRTVRRWTVENVSPTARFEDVYCVVEPETEQFTLDGGILTKNCPRYWYYAFSGADFSDDADAYAVANMTNGTMSHERLQKAMKDSGVMIDDEVKVICEDPPIFGFADGLLSWDEEEIVAEIKTMREESFQYRKQSNKAPVYHLEQLILYMKVLKKSQGVLIYESKNSHELHIIPVEVNDEYIRWVDGAFEWMREVRKAWEDKTLPTKPYRSNSKVCKGCPVKETCFAGPKGDVKILPLEPLSK